MRKFGADAIEMKLDMKKKLETNKNREGESPDSTKKTTTKTKSVAVSKSGRMLFFGIVGIIAIVCTVIYMKFISAPLITAIYPFKNQSGFIFSSLRILSSFPVLGIIIFSIFSGFGSTFETDNIVKAVVVCVLLTEGVITIGSISDSFVAEPKSKTHATSRFDKNRRGSYLVVIRDDKKVITKYSKKRWLIEFLTDKDVVILEKVKAGQRITFFGNKNPEIKDVVWGGYIKLLLNKPFNFTVDAPLIIKYQIGEKVELYFM